MTGLRHCERPASRSRIVVLTTALLKLAEYCRLLNQHTVVRLRSVGFDIAIHSSRIGLLAASSCKRAEAEAGIVVVVVAVAAAVVVVAVVVTVVVVVVMESVVRGQRRSGSDWSGGRH